MIDILIPLISLIALEVILGIDNIIFISIIAEKLPEKERDKLRYRGIGLAVVMRLCLLVFISWILKLDQTLFNVFEIDFSGKSLILISGGLFLLYKSTKEIYHKTEVAKEEYSSKPAVNVFFQTSIRSNFEPKICGLCCSLCYFSIDFIKFKFNNKWYIF